MKIGTKYITIHRNIKQVENDFKILTDNNEPEDITEQIKIFPGEINGRNFKFKDRNVTDEIYFMFPVVLCGELIEKDNDTTLIKIDIQIKINYFPLICYIVLALFLLSLVIKTLLAKTENIVANIIFLIAVLFGVPIIQYCMNLYSFNKIIKNINYYEEGYLDSY
jgi:hypothetical protein